jgi:quercetin dioxygenase-like cupin family protein
MGRILCLVLFSAALMVTALHNPENVRATPAVGFTATTVFSGRLGEIDVPGKPIIPDSSEDDRRAKVWLSQQKIAGPSDLYVQSNVWQPGGSTGWHTHPGNSLIIVAAGTVTEYIGPDLDCKPHVYTRGMTFVDPHGDHAHIIRNEGNAVARTIAVQLIPAGAVRRIDVADPGNCHF